jgi:hypothetical protein
MVEMLDNRPKERLVVDAQLDLVFERLDSRVLEGIERWADLADMSTRRSLSGSSFLGSSGDQPSFPRRALSRASMNWRTASSALPSFLSAIVSVPAFTLGEGCAFRRLLETPPKRRALAAGRVWRSTSRVHPEHAHAAQLTTEEKDILLELAQPIDQKQRSAFLAAVAAELKANGQPGAVGIGSVHRVARTVQRRFFDPPQLPNASTAARA